MADGLRELRDGFGKEDGPGLGAVSADGSGIVSLGFKVNMVRLSFVAAQAATDPNALSGSALRFSSSMPSDAALAGTQAAEVGMATFDVLARCVASHVVPPPDPADFATNLEWVSNGGVGERAESIGMEVCALMGRIGPAEVVAQLTNMSSGKPEMAASWLQVAALHKCPNQLESAIETTDALLE
ncbi:hypothetical protein ACOCJ4_05650 [Knoellia sp. CPCC 206435]|uniref:hypothetical protein n=1 Tax=Knoellia terrae TaxID=3404797 RepID=UPI003B42AEE1